MGVERIGTTPTRLETHVVKTEITNTSLVDCIMVAKGIPADEIDQIEAFTGNDFDAENIALALYNPVGPKWTIREIETGEPLVVGGFIQTGVTRWQTFFLATQKAWDQYGGEVTKHTIETLGKVVADQENIRIETYCLARRKLACEWYEKIGLTYEATLRGYGVRGESAVLYTLVRGAKD